MHDEQRDNLKQTMGKMTDAEKLELIEELVHSLRSPRNGNTPAELVKAQHETFRQLQGRLAAMPIAQDPYAHLGYGNEAHDRILYDLGQL